MSTTEPHIYSVGLRETSMRLDVFVATQTGMTRSQVHKMIDGGLVLVNGSRPKKAGQQVKEGDAVSVIPSRPSEKYDQRETLEIPVLAETTEYVVIDKPAGILSHPTMAHEHGTVTDWFRNQYPFVEGVGEDPARLGMVHRLDRDTSGVMVLAKTQTMFDHLKNQFKARTISKEYTALVYGAIGVDHDAIDFMIDRKEDGRMAARPHIDLMKVKNVGKGQEGRDALTEFLVLRRFVRHSLLQVKIHTGRTHQIRVHLFAYGNPIVGDPLYRNPKLVKKKDEALDRLFLHASRLAFEDMHGERVSYESPLPPKLSAFLDTLAS